MASENNFKEPKGTYVGIDLGTSNTVVSFFRDGSFEQVRFRRKMVIPSALYFETKDQIYFGEKAIKKGVSDPEHLITEFKRDLGGERVYVLPFAQQEESGDGIVHYIIDTNILITAPEILDSFMSNDIINLSHSVQQELGYRTSKEETKYAAEIAIEKINETNITKEVKFRKSHLELLPDDFTANTPNDDNDNRILSIAVDLKNNEPLKSVVLLTNDKGLQNKAKSIDIEFLDISGFRTQKNISQSKQKNGNLEITPKIASQLLLQHIREESERYMGEKVIKAVITVPANFSQAQVELTKRAGEDAGFEKVRIMKEPIAAGLSYSIDSSEVDSTILVYDFGGGTFDATVLRIGASKLEVLGVDGDPKLGGHDITQIVKDIIYEKLEDDVDLMMFDLPGSKLSESDYRRNVAMIEHAAEDAKLELSEFTSTNISIPNLMHPNGHPVSLDFDFTRQEFEEEIIEIRKRTIDVIKDLMASCSLETKDIDMIVMAGGSSNIPSIFKSIKETLGKGPHINKDTSLVISEGAVIEAIGIWGDSNTIQNRIIYNDKALFDFGIGLKDHKFDILIPADTLLPHRIQKDYSTEKVDQKMLTIRAFQRKRGFQNAIKTFDKGISYVDVINIDNLPASKIGELRITVTFELTKDDELKMSTAIFNNDGNEIDSNQVTISKASEMNHE